MKERVWRVVITILFKNIKYNVTTAVHASIIMNDIYLYIYIVTRYYYACIYHIIFMTTHMHKLESYNYIIVQCMYISNSMIPVINIGI